MLLQFIKNPFTEYQQVTRFAKFACTKIIPRRWILSQGNKGKKNQSVRKSPLFATLCISEKGYYVLPQMAQIHTDIFLTTEVRHTRIPLL